MMERLRRWRNDTLSGVVCVFVFQALLFPVLIVAELLLFALADERDARRWSNELRDWWLHL
jgi:hypothetical protein